MTVRELMRQLIELNPDADVIVELQTNNSSMCKELVGIQLKTKWTDATPTFKTPYLQVALTWQEMEEVARLESLKQKSHLEGVKQEQDEKAINRNIIGILC